MVPNPTEVFLIFENIILLNSQNLIFYVNVVNDHVVSEINILSGIFANEAYEASTASHVWNHSCS
jgi:hypothetical protein